jgi:alanine-synthesizing transaminase
MMSILGKKHMNFSRRTDWPRQRNLLTRALEKRQANGQIIHDLTLSNPTDCGIRYPASAILRALARSSGLVYRPDPRGLLSARKAVAAYYEHKAVQVDPAHVILTASTSEAYSVLFTLLCGPGENVLVPAPSYPLFEFIAQLGWVELRPYRLSYDHEWQVDIGSIISGLGENTRAIVLIHPHNPRVSFSRAHSSKRSPRWRANTIVHSSWTRFLPSMGTGRIPHVFSPLRAPGRL